MFVKTSISALALTCFLGAMEPVQLSPKDTPQGQKLRDIVMSYLDGLERKQESAEPVKDSNYFQEQLKVPFRHSVVIPTAKIKEEVLAGPLCIKENKGVLCAAHIIFLINIIQDKVIKTINIPSKMEAEDHHRPTPFSVEYARIAGMPEDQIFLGELDGRVLIADPKSYGVRTFGQVPGKVLGFFVDQKGDKIALRYESKDESGKSIPCFAVAAAYAPKAGALEISTKSLAANIARSETNKRRSWAPPLNASGGFNSWSHFAVATCNHEVKDITFEEDYCITHCATGNIEKWIIENIDTEPKLVKVATIEPLKP